MLKGNKYYGEKYNRGQTILRRVGFSEVIWELDDV